MGPADAPDRASAEACARHRSPAPPRRAATPRDWAAPRRGPARTARSGRRAGRPAPARDRAARRRGSTRAAGAAGPPEGAAGGPTTARDRLPRARGAPPAACRLYGPSWIMTCDDLYAPSGRVDAASPREAERPSPRTGPTRTGRGAGRPGLARRRRAAGPRARRRRPAPRRRRSQAPAQDARGLSGPAPGSALAKYEAYPSLPHARRAARDRPAAESGLAALVVSRPRSCCSSSARAARPGCGGTSAGGPAASATVAPRGRRARRLPTDAARADAGHLCRRRRATRCQDRQELQRHGGAAARREPPRSRTRTGSRSATRSRSRSRSRTADLRHPSRGRPGSRGRAQRSRRARVSARTASG